MASKRPAPRRDDEARTKARDKLAERLVKQGGMDSEKAHKTAAETARESERQR